MASIERTAYPVFARGYGTKELKQHFTPSEEEIEWVKAKCRFAPLRLNLAVQLKCFQHLNYFAPIAQIPVPIIDHVRSVLGYIDRIQPGYEIKNTHYRHLEAIRVYLRVTATHGKAATEAAEKSAIRAAELMDQRVDIINAVIEELITKRFELPAFRTLDELAERTHAQVLGGIYAKVFERMTPALLRMVATLEKSGTLERRLSEYNDLKKSARRPTKKHLELVADQLAWLESLGRMDAVFADVPDTKIRHFAAQAMAYDVAEMRECVEAKRYTLTLALIHRMQIRARDQLAEMFLRRVATIHKRAKDELEGTQRNQRGQVEKLVATLDGVLEIIQRDTNDTDAGREVRDYLAPLGDVEALRQSCAQVKASSGNNHLPLIWDYFKSHRSVLFRLVHLLNIQSTSQDMALLKALDIIKRYQDKHRIERIAEGVDLSFASERWRKALASSESGALRINRRVLEVCVFSYLADELRSGDLSISGSEEFGDFRAQLLPWQECVALLPGYCDKIGLPPTATEFVSSLREWLTDTAQALDKKFPECRGDVSLGPQGEPILRKVTAREIPPSAISLHMALVQRMPSRHVLDGMANIEHWLQFTRHFGLLFGNETKLKKNAEH